MAFFSIILFFVLTYCLGYSITFFIKREEHWLENFLTNIGFGLGAFAVLAPFLNLLRIQLDWRIFFVLSLLIPVYSLYTNVSKGRLKISLSAFKLNKSVVYILLVIVIFVAFFAVYHSGSFKYPYLEDDDPWLHAKVTKYIAYEKTTHHDPEIKMNYIDPYPPSYAMLMGVLHQTNDNVIWSLKFFNVLIISLGLIFFYFFSSKFFNSRRKALLATIFLALIPCFMSHFIWASSLAIVLFFPAFLAAEKIKDDDHWWITCAIVIAGIMMTQPSNAVIFGIMFGLYWLSKSILTKDFNTKIFLAGLIGLILSLVIFWIPTYITFGWDGLAEGIGFGSTSLLNFNAANAGGGLLYSWSDFIFAKTQSKMDNPVGIGWVLFYLGLFSFIVLLYRLFKNKFNKRTVTHLVMLLWLLFAFAGIHGNRLPWQLMPHRFWAIFAIPLVLICAEGLTALVAFAKKRGVPSAVIYILVIAGILITSGYPKYVVETSYWPPGTMWSSQEEIQGYTSLLQLPKGSKIMPLCSYDRKVIAFDMYAEPWDREYVDFKKRAFETPAEELHSWLKNRQYEYITLDSSCLKEYGINETNLKSQELLSSNFFTPAGNNQGFMLLALN